MSKEMRVADFIAEFVYSKLGVKHVFMVTGSGIMHLTDGVNCHEKLQTIYPHHEQTSSMAMDAYARATENIGVGFLYFSKVATYLIYVNSNINYSIFFHYIGDIQ